MATFDVEINSRKSAAAGEPLPANSPLYQVRSEDEAKAHQEMLKPGALVRIRGSHGMGKTSLIQQLLHSATRAGYKTAYLTLEAFDSTTRADLDSFLREFCLRVANALQIPDELDTYWDDFFGVTICCKSYFEEYLLPHIDGPLVLALDDADRLFSVQEVADDFFGLLRAWHEEAKTREIWQRLRLIVAYSTDLYVPQNINKSPFNVGLPLDLVPLSKAQLQTLLDLWQITPSDPEVSDLAEFTGGRPHLVQLACCGLSQNEGDLTALVEAALTPESPFSQSLLRLQQVLDAQPQLVAALTAVTTGTSPANPNDTDLCRLDSLGLISTANPRVKFSCALYAQWFQSR